MNFNKKWLWLLLLAVPLVLAATLRETRDHILSSFADSVRLTIKQPSTQSSNAIEIVRGTTLELGIPGTNTVAGLKLNVGLQSGTKVYNTYSTNISFTRNFTSAPVVTVAPSAVIVTNLNITAITVSNFTLAGGGGVSNTIQWIAVGVP